ncbi:MAG: hypothetical protein RJA34_2472 [Pseudomonadota bacterium]|jgi:hypothetical protein
MSLTINRRSFLQSLIAMGAGYFLAQDATAAQINQVWDQANANPWYFEVDDRGTISDPDVKENETWDDVFSVCASGLKTPSDVIDEVVSCQPLINHFQKLGEREVEYLKEELEDDPSPGLRRRRHILKVVEAIEEDPDDGWQTWVELEGKAGVGRFQEEIKDWLSEPADYNQWEFFPINHGSQGQAKAFFERLDDGIAAALCVVIIEGEHPGSSYYAAELRQSVEAANAVAQSMHLPFRFKKEGT